MNLFLLYIDPGTGSALFAIIIGIAAAAVFTFQAFFLKIKTNFSGGKAIHGTKNKFVIYAEDKRYWTLFKPVVEEFENRNIELLYLTQSRDDPVFNSGFKHIKAEYLGSGNKVFARLNFLSANFVLATTPGLDVYQWKRSKNVKHYCHILHSPILATYELYGLDYYDSILLSSCGQDKIFLRQIEEARGLPEKQIITVGCPYLDEFEKKMKQMPEEENHIFTVLVSPSWGKSALLTKFGEKLLDPLARTQWRIIVRPHPQSLISEKEKIDFLSEKYRENSNIFWDFERENIFSLKNANVMISDFSGIILDYLFLCQKPVFYAADKIDLRPYDEIEIYNTQDEMYIFQILEKTAIALNPDLLDKLPEQIINASSNTFLNQTISDIKAQVWNHQGESGKRVFDFIIKTAGDSNA